MGIGITPEQCNFCDFSTYMPCRTKERAQNCKNKEISSGAFMQQTFDTPRAKLLNEVMEIVHKDRNANYGNPEDNFAQIAGLWNQYIGSRFPAGSKESFALFTSADVAIMNMLIKVARLAKNPSHHDSAVDIAGYLQDMQHIQESGKPVGSASA